MWQAGPAWIPLPVRQDVEATRWRDIALLAGIVALPASGIHLTIGSREFVPTDLFMLGLSFLAALIMVFQLHESAAARAAALAHKFCREGIELHRFDRVERLPWSDVVGAEVRVRMRLDHERREGTDKVRRWHSIELAFANGAKYRINLAAYADNRAVGEAIWSCLPSGIGIDVLET